MSNHRAYLVALLVWGLPGSALADEEVGEFVQVCPWGSSPVSTGEGPEDFECPCWVGFERSEGDPDCYPIGDAPPCDGCDDGPDDPAPPDGGGDPGSPRPDPCEECADGFDDCKDQSEADRDQCQTDFETFARHKCGGDGIHVEFRSGDVFPVGVYCHRMEKDPDTWWGEPPLLGGPQHYYVPCEKLCFDGWMEGVGGSTAWDFEIGIGVGIDGPSAGIGGTLHTIPSGPIDSFDDFCEHLEKEDVYNCQIDYLDCMSDATESGCKSESQVPKGWSWELHAEMLKRIINYKRVIRWTDLVQFPRFWQR